MPRYIMKARVPSLTRAMHALGVEEDGDVQRRVTSEIAKNLPDFMPRKSGRLIGSMSVPSPTRIRVEGPYARFLFFGKTKAGADVEYSTDVNPHAGPHWDNRLVAERGDAIRASVQRYVARKRRWTT